MGVTHQEDQVRHLRLLAEWRLVAADAKPFWTANGLHLDVDWVERQLPDLSMVTEFKGGANCAPFSQPSHAIRAIPFHEKA